MNAGRTLGLLLRLWQDYMPEQHHGLTVATWSTHTLVKPVMPSEVGRGIPAEMLDLDAEINLRSYWDDVMVWIEQAISTDVRRIVDLGAGTGTGTFALAGAIRPCRGRCRRRFR